MSISSIFIYRPIATSLLGIGLALAGIVAFNFLPVAPLPQMDFPTINVQATFPGASPEIMASSVATPLERQIGRIAGVTEITSVSNLGATRLTVQFDLSRNIDGAARDIQSAINAAQNQLPPNLPNLPTYRKVNPADAPIMIITLTSNILSRGQMYDAASSILQQKLSQMPGIGQVIVGGSSLPAIRIELNPTQLNEQAIGLEQVRSVVVAQNVNRPKGNLTIDGKNFNIETNDQLFSAKDYESIIIAYRNNAPVRVKDVGTVVASVEDIRNAGLSDGKQAVALVVFKQPGANTIETVDNVRRQLPMLNASIPQAIDLTITMDRTVTIRASLKDVEGTLLIAICLVIAVVYFFLGNYRAALVPSITVPLSLLGTFGIMYLLGFSLNNLSLMALTIATGFVVDDAVVVLENISRHIESGQTRLNAALLGAKEVAFTVVSMSASLISIFIPILLMGGVVGRLLREFSVTLAVAIILSLVVSLTLCPMMCALLLRQEKTLSGSYRWVNWFKEQYAKSLHWGLEHDKLMLLFTLIAIVFSILLYIYIPKGFFPQQDTGRINAIFQAEQNMSFQAMNTKLTNFVSIIKNDPAVAHVVGFIGSSFYGGNTGNLYITLKALSERHYLNSDEVIARLRKELAKIPGAVVYMQSAQDLVVGGRQSNAQFQYTLTAHNLAELNAWAPKILAKVQKIPGIIDVNSDQRTLGLQMFITMDHDTAYRFNITPLQIDNTLYDAFGQRQISTMDTMINQYHVVMEAAKQFWLDPKSLNDIYVASPANNMVPLSTLASFDPSYTFLAVNHQGQFPAVTISFNLQPGTSLGDAVTAITQEVQTLNLPETINTTFSGIVQSFQDSLKTEPLLILTALIAVYIVLGMLYESLIHPITILSTLPSAGVGALLALIFTGTELNIISLVGIILLIGIVKKNAIMMIDFALESERQDHLSPKEAIYHAAVLRFRPIMMTTAAALLSAVPLAIGWGVGSELRRPLGIAIIGGLLLSQLLTLYTTPVVYLTLERFSRWSLKQWQSLKWGRKRWAST